MAKRKIAERMVVFDGLLQPLPTMRRPITRVLNFFFYFLCSRWYFKMFLFLWKMPSPVHCYISSWHRCPLVRAHFRRCGRPDETVTFFLKTQFCLKPIHVGIYLLLPFFCTHQLTHSWAIIPMVMISYLGSEFTHLFLQSFACFLSRNQRIRLQAWTRSLPSFVDI